jgi:hypothetical protein
MPAMTTNLNLVSMNNDTIVYQLDDHTTQDPSLVLFTRKEGNGPTANAEVSISVVRATHDVEGALIASRAVVGTWGKYPKHGTYSDVTQCLTTLKDIVNSDEFADALQKQRPLHFV